MSADPVEAAVEKFRREFSERWKAAAMKALAVECRVLSADDEVDIAANLFRAALGEQREEVERRVDCGMVEHPDEKPCGDCRACIFDDRERLRASLEEKEREIARIREEFDAIRQRTRSEVDRTLGADSVRTVVPGLGLLSGDDTLKRDLLIHYEYLSAAEHGLESRDRRIKELEEDAEKLRYQNTRLTMERNAAEAEVRRLKEQKTGEGR
jgi:hypothetical protein